MKAPTWCTVRQQAWTEELHIASTFILSFCDFLISRPSTSEGAHIKTQVLPVRYKGSVPHLTPADSPAFLSSPLSDESCVSTPKWQKEQREKTKGRNETQLHTETTGNKVTWTCWIQMSLSTWSSKRMRTTAVQASRKIRGWTIPQVWRQEKSQISTKKVQHKLLETPVESARAGWSPAPQHTRHTAYRTRQVRGCDVQNYH